MSMVKDQEENKDENTFERWHYRSTLRYLESRWRLQPSATVNGEAQKRTAALVEGRLHDDQALEPLPSRSTLFTRNDAANGSRLREAVDGGHQDGHQQRLAEGGGAVWFAQVSR